MQKQDTFVGAKGAAGVQVLPKNTSRRNSEKLASVPKAATDRTQKMGKRCIPLSLLKGHGVCHITYFGDFSVI